MIKLLFFSFLAFFAVPTMATAQQMMIGARWGVNFANQYYENIPDGETISGRTLGLGGLQFDYEFNPTWSISIQALYDQKGAHATMSPYVPGTILNGIFTGFPSSADWTTSYLEIPLLAKFSFGSGVIRPYIFVGPSIGYLLSNIETVQGNGTSYIENGVGALYPIDTTANIGDYTAKIDLSIVAGAGVKITLVSGPELFLDAIYAYGLTNSDNYSSDNFFGGTYVYSRDIRLAAGVLFPIH